MARRFEKLTFLNQSLIHKIQALDNRCEDKDHYHSKIYWNIIQNRQTDEFNDFLYYINDRLVAYLAMFVFEVHRAEISGFVDPRHRHKGIMKFLFQEARSEMLKREIQTCAFICNQSAFPAKQCALSLGGRYSYTEYEMSLKLSNKPFQVADDLHFRHANINDMLTLVELDNACFGTNVEATFNRFHRTMNETNREAWLVSLGNKIIGKIHVRYDQRLAYIHDFCVLPKFQGKGLGTNILQWALNTLREKGHKLIKLDVTTSNEEALSLYKKCGFEISSAYDFWEKDLMNQKKKRMRIH